MSDSISRRDWLRMIGTSGVAAGLGTGRATDVTAQESGFQSSVIAEHEVQANRASPSLLGNKVIQPQRELPVLHKTDVLTSDTVAFERHLAGYLVPPDLPSRCNAGSSGPNFQDHSCQNHSFQNHRAGSRAGQQANIGSR